MHEIQEIQKMRQQQLACLGRLLADFSHEMRNHLAVIQQANGLLEDILAMADQQDETPDLASLGSAVTQIKQRIGCSVTLCEHLSSMAHRSDTTLSSFQINELLDDLFVFWERSAQACKITLDFDLERGVKPIYNEPALLQYVLHQLYTFALGLMGKEKTLMIRTTQEAEQVAITFCLNGVTEHVSETDLETDLSGLSEMVEAATTTLGATFKKMRQSGTGDANPLQLQILVSSLHRDI
ncbi:MAG: hypothetical protein D3916_00280 [Candidatus Electrothrix sp. MAN1_4]|nr:hypothetical protein [Candidatus Electrothrix sp. MAN1_4]